MFDMRQKEMKEKLNKFHCKNECTLVHRYNIILFALRIEIFVIEIFAEKDNRE